MNALFHTYETHLADLEKATKYTVSNMQPCHLELWHLKQMYLTGTILSRISSCIEVLPHITSKQKNQLKLDLTRLSQMALPYFLAGTAANPVHHNFQTVENILLILSHRSNANHPDFEDYKKAVILALLHDIGNGYVDPDLKKVKKSDIADRRCELEEQDKTEAEIQDGIHPLIKEGEKYRKAHMVEGAKIAIKLLKEDANILEPEEIEEIAKIIKIHDNPSIAEYYSEAKKPYGEYLIPLNNDLAYTLREADRLWMVSQEGLEKDLFDDLRKSKKPDPFTKLRHNVKRFKDEYKLYEQATDITDKEKAGFQHKTLFRSEAGFTLCREYVWIWLARLAKECFGEAFIPSDADVEKVMALIFN